MSKTVRPARKAPASAKVLSIMGLTEKQAVARTQSHPDDPKGWKSLGAHCLEAGRLDEARTALERALNLAPRDAEALRVMADLEVKAGSLEDARRRLEEALDIEPQHQLGKIKLAEILHRLGQHEQALQRLETVIGPNARLAPWYSWHGVILLAMQRYDEARQDFETQIKLEPTDYSAWNNLGNVYRDTGDLEQAERCYAKAASLNHTDPLPRSNRLTAMHYQPGATVEDILQACKDWAAVFTPAVRPQRPVPADRSPAKVLRIGMFSDGFRQHPVGTMTVSALEHLARLGVEIHAYTTNNSVDAITRRFMALARQWTPIYHLNNEQFAERIHADQIDILIDLSGHNAGSRIRAMTMEPAPILVKWVGGLINTTGVEAIDYLISDRVESPLGSDHLYTEKLIRMPDDYICFVPPPQPPEVAPLPALRNGYITFGCFNNPTKINQTLLARWAELLHAVPQSRLFLKGAAYATQELRQRVVDTLAGHGIGEDRLRIEGRSPHLELLARYNEVDIALDPWPYSGGLTTCEAMLMGVPVVTLPGPTFAGRHSATHLANAGMPELIADDWGQYHARALQLASDLDSLSTIRTHLRRILLESPVCDAPRFARHLANALRAIWQRYCAGKPPAALALTPEGLPWFEDEEAPTTLTHPEPEGANNAGDWSFEFQGKIVTLDHGGAFVCDGPFNTLRQLRTLATIAIDPASRIDTAARLQADGHLEHYQPHMALGNGNPVKLYACLDSELSGTLEPLQGSEQPMPLRNRSTLLAGLPIPSVRVDDIAGLERIDWLILHPLHDNLAILDGATRHLDDVLVVQIGALFMDAFVQQTDISDVRKVLARHGMRLLQFRDSRQVSHFSADQQMASDAPKSQLLWADAVFVPTEARIATLDANRKLKLAFLLHAAYGASDLAHRVLQLTDPLSADKFLQSGGWAVPNKTPAASHEPRAEIITAPALLRSKATHLRARVGVPLYNEENYIEQTIRSLKAQDADGVSFLIADNASTDRTLEIVQDVVGGDSRFEIFRQEHNQGALTNFCFLFEQTRSDYFMWLGGHDFLSPGYLRQAIAALDQDPTLSMVLGAPRAVQGDQVSPLEAARYAFDSPAPAQRYVDSVATLVNCTIIHSLFRRADLDGFDIWREVISGDHVLISRLLWKGRLAYLGNECYYRRYFPARTSTPEERITGEKRQMPRADFYQHYQDDFAKLAEASLDPATVASLQKTIRDILLKRFG